MKVFLYHPKTGRKFQIIRLDKEKKIVTLQGETAQFSHKFDKELFKSMGYQLIQEGPDTGQS